MENFLKQNRIDWLYHFTRAENLPSILKYGLLPRETLELSCIDSQFNDNYRYDKCLNAVCMSIEFPNYRMFYKYRKQNPSIDWVVIRLDAQILCDYECVYCWTNAGSANMYDTSIEERMGKEAFFDLFKDRNGYPQRDELNIPMYYPTNPQAEVLVLGSIPVSYIQKIYVNSTSTLMKYKDIVPHNIDILIESEAFSYRKDWSFWQ